MNEKRFHFLRDQIAHTSRYNLLLHKEIRKLQEYNALSENAQNELKEKRAEECIRHAIRHSSFYADFYKGRFSKNFSFQDFSSLPIINKWNIIANTKRLATVPMLLLKEGQTSGTSGTPMSVYRSWGDILRDNAYVWFYRSTHGLNIGDPIVIIRGKLARDQLYHYNKAENSLYLSAYMLSKSNTSLFAKMIIDFKPKAVCAWPGSVFTLVNLMSESGFRIHVPLVFTASESLYSFQRDKIEKYFNAKIFDYYGNGERSIALGQCEYGNYHEMPLYSINEFLDKGVITTSLISKAYPIIRYYIDDYFVMMQEICKCGRTKGVKNIDGRSDDAVVVADGSLVTGLSLVFRGVHHLLYAQIVQDYINEVQVNVVVTNAFSHADELQIYKQLKDKLGKTLVIRLNTVEEKDLIKSKSGKFQLVISNIKKHQRRE